MIDRLAQFKILAGLNGQKSDEQFDPSLNDEVYHDEDEFEESQFDSNFYEEVKSVRVLIKNILINTNTMQNLQVRYVKATKGALQKQISEEINAILLENVNIQKKMKYFLTSIENSVKNCQKKQPKSSQTIMKKAFYLNLRKEVSEALMKQGKFEEDFQKKVKEKMKRQVKLIDKNLSSKQVEELVEDPQAVEKMLQKKIYGSQANIQMKNKVGDIQDKFRDIQRLQASVQHCASLLNELLNLTFAQGEKIDSIETNVLQCKEKTKSAAQKLEKSKKHFECSKKCVCIVIIAALVIMTIIVLVVLITK